jgi:Protein CHAPERONE-LIKE PROTEIN OF POR1-like
MSQPTPYERLGIGMDASFEEIQAAKKHLQSSSGGDQKSIDDAEAAYDSILMDRLKSVPEGIRFPEKSVQTLSLPKLSPPKVVSDKLGDLVEVPTGRNLAIGAGVATVLMASAALPDNGEGLPLLLALSAGYTIFTLRAKSNKLGRAVAITSLGLVSSFALILTVVSISGLPVDSMLAGKVYTFGAIVTLWLIGSFLK